MTPRDTAQVRPGEELPRESLAVWLSTRLPGAGTVEIEQFPGGHSNLTYLVRIGAGEYVLRRPPLGPVAATAHDMVREARVLQALHAHYPLAPRVFAICEDTTIIGAPFFVMERRHGVVIRSGLPAAWAVIPEAADRISRALIDGLADLHRIDVQATGLAALGRPEGFLERQVRGWSERWRQAQTEPVDSMAPVIAWLAEHQPEPTATTIVHHDYKLDNVMLDPADPGRLVAVLYWEMATVGDPLADLGLTLTYWTLPEARRVAGMDQVEGWWTRDALVARYAARTGVNVEPLPWYEVVGIFKLGVIVQQIYARFVRGQTQDPRFRDMGRIGGRARRPRRGAHPMTFATDQLAAGIPDKWPAPG